LAVLALSIEPMSYRRTFFDRHGPDAAAYLTAGVWGAVMAVLAFPLLNRHGITFAGVAGSLGVGALVGGLGPAIGHLAGSAWHAVALDGGSTPGAPQYSYEHSLIMRGRVAEALASFEAIIAADPSALQPRMVAADLYLRVANNAARSAELLREAQQIRPISPGDDVYIANRLVDLYIGPLDEPYKALRELRRLIDRHENTPAARHARLALAELKARYVTRDEG
jgi:tetratricopeptide (TPR) repeat protein